MANNSRKRRQPKKLQLSPTKTTQKSVKICVRATADSRFVVSNSTLAESLNVGNGLPSSINQENSFIAEATFVEETGENLLQELELTPSVSSGQRTGK